MRKGSGKFHTLWKMIGRDIKGSFGRFFAVFAIVAIGTGFFAGVRITTPVMVNTVNIFFRESRFFDYRLLSTVGWGDEEVEAFSKEDGVLAAEGDWQYDVICRLEDDSEAVYKVHSLPEVLNAVQLKEGRMPENPGECLVDADNRDLALGDRIVFPDTNDGDTLQALDVRTVTIVGFADSSLYINFQRGTTSKGNGTVKGFMYLPREAFISDAYTEIYVKLDTDYDIYSKQYNDQMDELRPRWEALIDEAAQGRYISLKESAKADLEEAQKEFEEQKAEGEKKLKEAEKELEEGKSRLDAAALELEEGKTGLDEAQSQLDGVKDELDAAAGTLSSGGSSLAAAQAQLSAGKAVLDAAREELLSAREQLDSAKTQLDFYDLQLSAQKILLDEAGAGLSQARDYLEDITAQMEGYDPEDLRYQALSLLYDTGMNVYQSALSEYESRNASYQQAAAEYEAGKAEYEQGLSQYEQSLAEYNAGLAQYEAGVAAYEQARAEYNMGMSSYNEGLSQYEQGLSDYEQGREDYGSGLSEYEEGLKDYESGLSEYEDAKKTFDEEIADAREKLQEAREELDAFKAPDTYLLERGTNIGYACFENDSKIVEQVARVFPVFFILVAILVCMTTMTRMVEERRGQIGVMKGLGYSAGDIMFTFLAYAGIAAAAGCIVGYIVGSYLFPSVIWNAYGIMYNSMPVKFMFDFKLAAAVFIISIAAACGTTYLTCRSVLREAAAGLMRPRAPKAGKKVFLERIPFIWDHLKYTHKISARNSLRYKKRFFMMVVGISGCMALLLTGFGLRDTISTFVSTQFKEIQTAQASIVTEPDSSKGRELSPEIKETMAEIGASYAPYYQGSWDLIFNNGSKSITLVAPADYEGLEPFFRLRAMDGGEMIPPAAGEALVSISISSRYGIKEGDEITLRNDKMETIQARVSGVFENYVYNYVLVSQETIKEATGRYQINGAYVNFPEGDDVYRTQTYLAECGDVISVNVYAQMEEMIAGMMSSLNYLVLVIIISGAALAFVVLYNLTNINILERVREIATIKVLGFRKRETSAYVFRENIVLTIIGAAVGVGLGVLLHRFVISKIVVDMVYFRVEISALSFVLSVLMTFLFTILVNRIMSVKLEKINMAESLKSVE